MAAFDPSTDYFGSKYRKWDGVAPEADDEPGDEPQVEDVTDMLSVCDSTYSRRSARKKTRARRAAERAQEEEDAAFKKCVFCRELRVGELTCDAYCGTCPAQDRDNMSWAHAACLRKHNAPFQVKYGVGETLNTTGRWIQWSCPKCLRIAAELKKAAEERAASVRAVDAAHCVPRKLADGEDRGEVEASFDFSKWDAALKGEDMDDDERAEVERKEDEVAEEVRKRGAERSKKEITLAWKAKMKADRDAQEKKEKAALKGYTPKGPPVSLGTTARRRPHGRDALQRPQGRRRQREGRRRRARRRPAPRGQLLVRGAGFRGGAFGEAREPRAAPARAARAPRAPPRGPGRAALRGPEDARRALGRRLPRGGGGDAQGSTRERNSQLQSLISRPFSTRFG